MDTVEFMPPPNLLPKTHSEDTHRVQFYKDEPFLIRSVAQHLAASLRNGGSAVVLATKAPRDEILQELAKLEIPADTLFHRYVAHDASEALSEFMRNDLPDPDRFNDFA